MQKNPKIIKGMIILLLGVSILITGCRTTSPIIQEAPTLGKVSTIETSSPISGNTATASPTKLIMASPTREPSSTATLAPTPTETTTATPVPPPTETPLPSLTPTYAILRGTVLEQANCRYGPGAAYLYKYGVYAGYYMDMIGRNENGTWVVVQAIGGSNPCWVKASLIKIKGDVMSLAPTWLPLPESPYYGPLTGVSAVRNGNSVIISWDTLNLKAGDDSLQYPYLVEAWLCKDGQLAFTPLGSWETMLTVEDEPGCSVASHARVYGVEKHGYTAWVNIPWPQP